MALPTLLDAVERLPAFARLLNTLPDPGGRLTVSGLPGSSDCVVLAALARRLPGRFFVVVTDALPDAERWLADLESLVDEPAPGAGADGASPGAVPTAQSPVALYPPREGFGEAEPHAEVAGERVETLERIGRGGVRILLTTARAVLERTRLPRAVQGSRLELRKGDVRRPEDLAAHLEAIGFERVPMVEDVAQFSVRGGIFDIYSFGMAAPVRLEFWGDEVTELRHFDLLTQRSTRDADVALVLPVDGQVSEQVADEYDRVTLPELWPPDAVLVYPSGAHVEPELRRTWDEAQHHVELARRRGEDTASRDELYQPPADAAAALARFGTVQIVPPGTSGDPSPVPELVFPLRAPDPVDRDIKRLRRMLADGTHTLILCDNAGQAERLEELLAEGGSAPITVTLVIGVLGGGFVIPGDGGRGTGDEASRGGSFPVPRPPSQGLRVLTDHEIFRRERRIRRVRKYGTGGSLEAITALKPGDYVVHLEHGVGIYRGIETIFVKESTVEVAVIEYEGGDRLNVPLYRVDQIERYRAAGDVSGDAPPPRLHRLGGKRWAQQRDKTRAAIQEMTVELLDLYARRKVASRPAHV
ncbi:MAG TPA: CarD family transcriptional regulator, partial [Gemmatimonadaceae bacterium]|nr:CarD family transcriptional regulator [Gemmatimonadaceae bacterium]